VCSNAFIINNNNKVKGSLNYPEDHDNLIKHIINLNPFPHSTVMFDKKILKTVKGYNERCKKSVDFNFYLELLINQAKFKCVQTPLIKLFLDEGTWGKQDDEALQFRYGLIGLVNYLQKVNGGMGILDLNEDEWIKSKNKFDEWFNKKGFLFRVNAKRKLNQSRCSLHNNNYLEAIINLFKAFIHDPYFFMYRGLGLKFPQDINEIISILNQN